MNVQTNLSNKSISGNRTSPMKTIWQKSKIISLLCAIPFALPVVL